MILILGKRFLCFFDMSLQKNVKSHVYWILKKKRKNVFSNYECSSENLKKICTKLMLVC